MDLNSDDAATGNALVSGSEGGDVEEDEEMPSTEDGRLPNRLVELFSSYSRIERRRTEIEEKRNEITLRTLQVSDDVDKRQYDYYMERLAVEERLNLKRYGMAQLIIVFGMAAITIVGSLFLYMIFFGNQSQSQVAISILDGGIWVLVGAIIGYPFISLMKRLWRR